MGVLFGYFLYMWIVGYGKAIKFSLYFWVVCSNWRSLIFNKGNKYEIVN